MWGFFLIVFKNKQYFYQKEFVTTTRMRIFVAFRKKPILYNIDSIIYMKQARLNKDTTLSGQHIGTTEWCLNNTAVLA